MSESDALVHSENLPSEQSGELLRLPRERAKWDWMSFFVRRRSGEVYRAKTDGEEAAFVCGAEPAKPIGDRVLNASEKERTFSTAIPTPCTCRPATKPLLPRKRFANC